MLSPQETVARYIASWMNTVHHTEQVIRQAREFFDGWLDLFPTWADFVQALGSESLPEFGASRESTVKQVSDWLGGAAEAGVLDTELSVMALSDYDMLCCMIDENNTQQQITPKIVFENVIAALTLAEDFLISTENVGEFNNLVKSKTRSLGNESHFWSSIQYGQAKAAVAETGDGLGKDVIKHFLPRHAIPGASAYFPR